MFEAGRVRPAFISRLYLEVSLSPWVSNLAHRRGGATACDSRLPCLRLAPALAVGFVWTICSSSEGSETISLSGRRRRKASLRPVLPPVQTAVPSLPGPAFNFVAFANMVLGPISHISPAKSGKPPGGMARSWARNQGRTG